MSSSSKRSSKPPPAEKSAERAAGTERVAKRIARAGICSRREAERLIADGRVRVDGQIIETPATLVGPETRVMVDDRLVPRPAPAMLWRYHKPAGEIVSRSDPEGRRTVFDGLPESLGYVVAVGRLDLSSEGLLLLTNDGELARRLELPATGWTRRYRVRVHGRPDARALKALEKGCTIDGVRYGAINAAIDSEQKGANAWLTVALKEGKNREVRRVLEHLGLKVNRLIRTSYGPFQLGTLKRGGVDKVPDKVLREQLGEAPAGKDKPARRKTLRPKTTSADRRR